MSGLYSKPADKQLENKSFMINVLYMYENLNTMHVHIANQCPKYCMNKIIVLEYTDHISYAALVI